ncbi:MAG TPA: metallophosphoesterase [Bryobacteraceae bacterium]|nr:metallophosphoesterase [Bryobacteraceae bacterium]
MAKLEQFRDPELSLWQSAVDEVVARKRAGSQAQDIGGAAPITRPDPNDAMIRMATLHARAVETAREQGAPEPEPGPPPTAAATEGIGEVIQYCASLARNYAIAKFRGDDAAADRYHTQLTAKFGVCDSGWVDTAVKYAEFLAKREQVPYRVYHNIGDFVIDGKLPAKARVALLADWGTGQAEARRVLRQIASKNPDVVIHLGDIYYSATDFETQNYFYQVWDSLLDLKKVASYTLSGNHDMFSGGAAYYRLIDQLGQPASYFCLRNDHWQFIALDTGLNDRVPGGNVPTFLQDTEVAWLKDKIDNRQGRRTVLLSHHQLFAAFEGICGKAANDHLNQQLAPLLPNVDIWFWGHEHNLVVYQKYMNVLARCIGHGAFPVGPTEIPDKPKFPEVPIQDVRLDLDPLGAFYTHGYVIIDLDGTAANIAYYQDSDEDNPQFTEKL